MVLFEIAGELRPLDDRTAETLAERFRVAVAERADELNLEGCGFLANAIESALVGATSAPIAVDENAAESLFRQLNSLMTSPDSVDPAYELYLEVRRFLGRLYS